MYLSGFDIIFYILIAPALIAAIPLSIIAIVRTVRMQSELDKIKKASEENKE